MKPPKLNIQSVRWEDDGTYFQGKISVPPRMVPTINAIQEHIGAEYTIRLDRKKVKFRITNVDFQCDDGSWTAEWHGRDIASWKKSITNG